MFDGIQVGDAQHPGHQRTGARATPRSHRHTVGTRPADEVGDDEKVARKPHRADHIELALQTCVIDVVANTIGNTPCQTLRQTVGRLGANEVIGTASIGHRIVRQATLAKLQRQTAALRNGNAVGERFGQISKQDRHFFGRAQVLLGRVFALPRRIGQLRAILNAHARLVYVKLILCQKAHVVGGHHRHLALHSQLQCAGNIGFLAAATDTLQFQVIAITEQLLPVL